MPGFDAGDAPDVYSGDGDVEVEVEALVVDLLLGWHGDGVVHVTKRVLLFVTLTMNRRSFARAKMAPNSAQMITNSRQESQ